MAEVIPLDRRYSGRFWMLNEDEDAALEYLPHQDVVMYVRGIKPHLDMATGLVGIQRRLSLKGLSEVCEVRRPRGSTQPDLVLSRDAVRECIKRLEGRGLLARVRSGERAEWLVFRLPLAHLPLVRSNEEPHRNPTGGPPRQNPDNARPAERSTPQEPHGMSPTHQEIKNINNSPTESVGNLPVSDASGDAVDQGGGVVGIGSCPHSEILSLWAEVLPQCRQPRRALWNDSAAARNLAQRWKQASRITHSSGSGVLYTSRDEGLVWWRKLFEYIATRCAGFLLSDDNPWFDLQWLVKKNNFIKVLDKKYEDRA